MANLERLMERYGKIIPDQKQKTLCKSTKMANMQSHRRFIAGLITYYTLKGY